MSLTPKSLFLTSFLVLHVSLVLPPMETTAISSSSSDLMEVLHHHGLPGGLFPRNVMSFKLDRTGRMEVHMHHPCWAQYETTMFFDSMVRANLSFGKLKVLEGMSREELFVWLPVKDIRVTDPTSGLIVIDIGLALKRLSFSRFEDPPICKSDDELSLQMGERKMNDERLFIYFKGCLLLIFTILCYSYWDSIETILNIMYNLIIAMPSHNYMKALF